MKRTLTTLCVLAALAVPSAMADDMTLGSFGFSTDAAKAGSVTVPASATNALTLTLGELTIVGEETDGYKHTGSYLCPNVNVGMGTESAPRSWTQEFTLTNDADAPLTLSAITVNVGGMKSSNNWQTGSNKPVDITFTMGDVSHVWTAVDVSKGESVPALSFTFETPVELDKGASVNFSIQAANNPGYDDGSYVALTGMTVTGSIPEPATATLSLLALAGLAARRRR